MSNRQSASEIDDDAAAWAARVDGRDLDDEPDQDLRDWLAGDERRGGAFLRAQAALSFLDRARVLAGTDAANPPGRPAALTRRRVLALGATGAALAAGLGAAMVLAPGWRRYGTALGEIRRLPLQDGSLIAINTGTQLEVALRPRIRQVRLDHGEAWFEVAKDAARPFVVQTSDVRVRAVGTAFSVRRRGDGAEILVTEGVVETWLKGASASPARVVAGSRAMIGPSAPPVVVRAPLEVERSLAWRTGQIALDGETLAAAVAEFNRYNQRQIIIDDPQLANERFAGLFHTNEPESFARAVAATIGAQITSDGANIRLTRPRVS